MSWVGPRIWIRVRIRLRLMPRPGWIGFALTEARCRVLFWWNMKSSSSSVLPDKNQGYKIVIQDQG